MENIHTDTVSAYLDGSTFVLSSKADFDANGDGVVDVGTRIDPRETLFHLSDVGRVELPADPAFRFIGAPGQTVWLAPQIQNHALIWPGFSTEDPNLRGKVDGNRLTVRLVGAEGPGDVELFLGTGSPERTFSSRTSLPPWTIGVPQHVHMNWAFSRPGTYRLTFEMSGTVDGRQQTARNDYVFVVGDLAAHTRETSTSLTVDRREAATGEPFLFTARVSPSAEGAIQFRDTTTNVVLGHTPVRDGRASFRADALVPGEHRIVAEFVPTWSNDFTRSASPPVPVSVSGEVAQRPDADDTLPVSDVQLGTASPGTAVQVTTGGRVTAGGTVGLRIGPTRHAGEWVSVWLHAPRPAWQGWVQADLRGALSIDIPAGTPAGEARIVVKDREGSLIGWDRVMIARPASAGGGGSVPPPPAGGTGQSPPPARAPAAAPQQCTPGLVLDNGHIDAFNVSAANGKAVLQLKEDVTGHQVIREAETVLLRVKESAFRSNIPAGTPGAPSGYVLPLTQDPNLIWPGWDTNRTSPSGHTDVSIHITGVDGPGRIHLYSQQPFGGLRSLLTDGGYTLPGTIREPVPAHTHAQWVFTEKGIYKLTAHAVATDPRTGTTLTTGSHTYTFQVGDVPLGDSLCGLAATGAAVGAEVQAAVAAAAAAAMAADQAREIEEAEARAEDSDSDKAKGARADTERDEADSPLALLIGEGTDPVALGLVVGGGVLAVAGIAGATVWYLRRLRAATSGANAASAS
ncbi:choice-of-anchor M domain-containing protein [Microbacterium album]|uniref:choice-of-anchor M domain-containing protein n=1 Tax=Microbacterium album TaxID=2053191 RepID=UPI001666FB4A|nr:choice-of-anchor M domain-containing protein [Microbacterium album]